jgi:DNA primase catalytic core
VARIADSEIDRLKAEVSVAQLIEAAGTTLVHRGGILWARCPFHEDSASSLTIMADQNLFRCGKCGAEGGPIEWVMKKNGVSLRHAVELLREGLPGVTDETVKHSTVRALPPPVALDADDQALLDQVAGYYHETLKNSPEAHAYLQERGIGNGEAVQRFKLGFANRTLGLRLPSKQRKDGADIRSRLARIGIYRDSGHEHFNGSLIVPVFDAGGHVIEVYGCKIRDDLRTGTPKHLYLPGPPKGVWNLDGLQASGGEIILCEGLIDALTFWCVGYRNVTACYGLGSFTPDHLAAFKAFEIERVLIAYGRSEAADRSADKLSEELQSEGFGCYRVVFPQGMDANAYALKFVPASKSLGLLIRKAEWRGKGQAPSPPTSCPMSDTLAAIAPVAYAEAMSRGAAEEAASTDDAEEQPQESSPVAEPIPPNVPAPYVSTDPQIEIGERDITISFGNRSYRARGHEKNLAVDVMRVNLLARSGEAFHVDTFDLYSAKARANFTQMAAGEIGMKPDAVKTDLGKVLLKLEALQDERIRETLRPEPSAREIAAAERDAALALLRKPDLLDRILAAFDDCGLVGEATNKLVAYLATVSRKLANPLAVLVQSSSAAGKSSLMDAVLAFVPEEDRVRYSALTGQALFYMGETSLKHRVLAIAEEEGATRASYALKLLQSEGEITIASTAKDSETGFLITQDYRVEGPVMLFLTTTAIAVDEELMNRSIILSVDEGRAQTEAIHRLQRKKHTLAGLLAKSAKDELLTLHRNAQRLLRPLAVVNPYADKLGFLSDRTRTRRDHEKYLTLIDAITLLHQHQRVIRHIGEDEHEIEYVEVALADIETANRLAHEVLGCSIDALPPQTRVLLASIKLLVEERVQLSGFARSDVRFTRRELRETTHASDTQLKVHLSRLTEFEYLIVHRTGRGQGHVYELIYDGDGSEGPHLSGLIDVSALSSFTYDAQRSAAKGERSGLGRGVVGLQSGGGRDAQSNEKPSTSAVSVEQNGIDAKTHVTEATAPTAATNR